MVLMSVLMVAVVLIFLDPILSLRLNDLGMKPDNVGIGFAVMALTYTLGCLFGSCFIGDSLDARYMVSGSFVLTGVFLILTAGLISQSVIETMIGLAFMSFFTAGVFLPSIPEATD